MERKARKNAAKEKSFQILAGILRDNGIRVRREELKRGHGWQAVSGDCQVHKDDQIQKHNIVFVDRRLSQDDQIDFIIERIVMNRIMPSGTIMDMLPGRIAKALRTRLQMAGLEQDVPHENQINEE